MPYFDNEGVKIYYEMEGNGPDLIMIHGFASNIENNWKQTNWVKILKDDYHLILIDNRGHGKSDKPIEKTQYGIKMVEDVIKLMDHLSIKKANFFGYSMGSRITLNLVIRYPARIKCAILGGFGFPSEKTNIRSIYQPIINALLVENPNQIKNPIAQEFRRFAESTGGNLKALAALMTNYIEDPEIMLTSAKEIKKELKKIKIPILTVVGSQDILIENKTQIADLIPKACHIQIQGRDHLTVVADNKFHMFVKAFLNFVNKT
ncbi:MAG: alpha/beta fold hydrolase [Promethearchaeota archaeon]